MTEERPFVAARPDDGPQVEEVDLTPDTPPDIQRMAVAAEAGSSRWGMVVGGVAVLAGIVIFALGLTEAVAWEFAGPGVSAKVQTSAAGIVIATIGLCVIALTRPKIRIRGDDGGTPR